MKRLEQQIDFILEVDKLKSITRQTYILDGERKENDSEHSWHLTLMCMLLNEYSNEKIDTLKVMRMLLIHDIVEIDAGDTYAYDEAGNLTKREREVAAAERIFRILPEDQANEMIALWEEFELSESPEAKFANTMDKLQPLLLNDKSGGLAWKEHGINISQVLKRNESTHLGSEELWDYAKKLIDKNLELGTLIS